MVPTGTKAKRLSSVNDTTETIHHHHHHHHQRACLEWLIFKPATLLKRDSNMFPVNIANFFRTSLLIEHLWWLFLSSVIIKSLLTTF